MYQNNLSLFFKLFLIALFLMGCEIKSVKKDAFHSQQLTSSLNYGQSITHRIGAREFVWRFACDGGDCVIGNFIGGDYWIAPKATDEQVTIISVSPDGDQNGMMINPGSSHEQGFLSCNAKISRFYKDSLNLMSQLPLNVKPDSSLVKSAKKESNESCWGRSNENSCCVDAYDVLTVLKEPLNDSQIYFRPGFSGNDKRLFNLSDFSLNKIPKRKDIPSNVITDSFDQIGMRWHAPYVDHFMSYYADSGRAFAPAQVLPNYAAHQNKLYLDDLISIMGSQTDQEKMPAITGLLQRGLDLYSSMQNGVVWPSGAGQQLGRKPPIVFFATLVNDDEIKKIVKEMADLPTKITQEDGQIRLIPTSEGGAGEPVWGDFQTGGCTEDGYWTQLFNAQQYEGGSKQKIGSGDNKRTCGDPYGWIDGPAGMPGDAYMACCTTGGYIEYVLAQYLMPSLCESANDPKLISYVNRVLDHGILTQPDICAPPDPNESTECNPYKKNNPGCLYYKKTWGPDPHHPGLCIKNGDGQRGRYPAINGKKISKIDNEGKLSTYLRKKLNLQNIPACNIN